MNNLEWDRHHAQRLCLCGHKGLQHSLAGIARECFYCKCPAFAPDDTLEILEVLAR